MGQIYKVSDPRSAELRAFMKASTEQRRFVAGGVRGPEVRHGVCTLWQPPVNGAVYCVSSDPLRSRPQKELGV